jgi:sec-independent protein translocase protein TatB
MFGIGFWELLVIVLFILLVMGPDKVGPIARAVGRAMREMRRGVDEFKDTFNVDEQVRDIRAIRSDLIEDIESEVEDVEVVRASGPGDDDGDDHGDGDDDGDDDGDRQEDG